MTREEFNNAILKEFASYQDKELEKPAVQLFYDSYIIAKVITIKNYLLDFYDENIKDLFAYEEEHSTLLSDLCAYEWSYGVPMWTNWELLSLLVHDFASEAAQKAIDKT